GDGPAEQRDQVVGQDDVGVRGLELAGLRGDRAGLSLVERGQRPGEPPGDQRLVEPLGEAGSVVGHLSCASSQTVRRDTVSSHVRSSPAVGARSYPWWWDASDSVAHTWWAWRARAGSST